MQPLRRESYLRACLVSTSGLVIVLSALGGFTASAAHAQDDPVERAVVLCETAEGLYREGRFELAVELLLEARSLHDDPAISYNLARAYEELARPEDAIAAYRHYLDVAPEAGDRSEVEARIARLEAEARAAVSGGADGAEQGGGASSDGAERGGGAHGASSGSAGTVSDGVDGGGGSGSGGGGGGVSIPAIVVSAVGVLGVGAGIAFGALSNGRHAQAEDDPIHRTSMAEFDESKTFADVADVLFVAGGVVAALGVTWLIIDLSTTHDDTPAAVSLRVGPGTLALSAALP